MADKKIMLNLGCGQNRPANWINTDSSLNSLFQKFTLFRAFKGSALAKVIYEGPARFMDLRSRWHFDSETVDVVYASHVFEHLSRQDAAHFLAESRRVLRTRGVLRLVVPDLRGLSENYLRAVTNGEEGAADEFLYALNLHLDNCYPEERRWIVKLINRMQGFPHQHKYMYDDLSLTKLLKLSGFSGVRSQQYGSSAYIDEIEDVEFTAEGIASIYLEAIKE